MEIDEHPESQWCAHGEEWPWDSGVQKYANPHGGDIEFADAGAFPEECYPTYGNREAWEMARDLGVVSDGDREHRTGR